MSETSPSRGWSTFSKQRESNLALQKLHRSGLEADESSFSLDTAKAIDQEWLTGFSLIEDASCLAKSKNVMVCPVDCQKR